MCVDRLETDGACLAIAADSAPGGLLAASGAMGGLVEGLQFRFGEGPCIEALASGSPVLEGDLADGGLARWPDFAAAALDAGAAAVFAFPLQVGAARIGVLDLTRTAAGLLDRSRLGDALVLAEIATEMLLALQQGAAADDIGARLSGVGAQRMHVHQAAGMVSVQLRTDVGTALTRLRACAAAEDRTLEAVATDVVARRLTFEA